MKKILFVLPALLLAAMIGMTTVSCFAPSYKDGDTVAASEFEPADTSLLAKKKLADSTQVAVCGRQRRDVLCRFRLHKTFPSACVLSIKARHVCLWQDTSYKGEGKCRFQQCCAC